jgi:hypothetical protein
MSRHRNILRLLLRLCQPCSAQQAQWYLPHLSVEEIHAQLEELKAAGILVAADDYLDSTERVYMLTAISRAELWEIEDGVGRMPRPLAYSIILAIALAVWGAIFMVAHFLGVV